MDIISKYSYEYNLSKSLVASVINIESHYDSKAISDAGAIGLMQLMPNTAEEIARKLGVEDYDLNDVEINIRFGCYYLRYLLDMFDENIINSLCAYNWGLKNVQNWLHEGNLDDSGTITNIPVDETRGYIKKYKFNNIVYSKILNVK